MLDRIPPPPSVENASEPSESEGRAPVPAAAHWAHAGWAALLASGLLGAGGAARTPEGWLVGVPGLWPTLAVVGVVAALRWWAGREAAGPVASLLPLLLLSCSGLAVPGLAALTGRVLFALFLAGAVVVISRGERRPARWLFFPIVLAVYCTGAYRVQTQVGPQGDEPHYLMVAESLLRDFDLSLETDYAEGRYRAFFDGLLEPHYRVRGRNGEIFSLHAVGLSVLVLPAYALGGYPAASFFMAFLCALLAREIRGLLEDAFGPGGATEGAAWVMALAPPVVHYSGLLFTEAPAALIVAFTLRRAARAGSWTPREACLVSLALAFLPWLNVRYAPLSVLMAAYVLWQRPARRVVMAFAAPAILALGALLLYHRALYGFYDPRLVYGRRPEFALAALGEGLPGLLLDQEFGLLVYAPLFALAVPGAWVLWRRDRGRAAVAALGIAIVLALAGTWHMWRGGFNPPARFLLPVIPLFALFAAAGLRVRASAGAAFLVGFSLFTAALGLRDPALVHRDRDGTAPLWREASGAEEWTRLLPAYVLSDPDRDRLACVWAIALVLAIAGRRPPSVASVALASAGLLAAAGSASWLSQARTGGRDAVRLLGRAAIAVPAFRTVAAAPARWSPADAGLLPLYEPHRYPDGAEIGSRLSLPPGSFHLKVDAEALSAVPTAPRLDVLGEGRTPSRRSYSMSREENGVGGVFAVGPGEKAASLRLLGGPPLVLRELRLDPSTFGPVTGLNR